MEREDVVLILLKKIWGYLVGHPWSFVIIAGAVLVIVSVGSLSFYQKSSSIITKMLLALFWFVIFVVFVVVLLLIRRGTIVLW